MTFPRKKAKLFVSRTACNYKREILARCEVLYRKLVCVITPCFSKKMLSGMFLKIFQVLADEEMGK